MATTHVYAGVAGTVGMTHNGTLAGVFRQDVGDNKWQKLGGGLPDGRRGPRDHRACRRHRHGLCRQHQGPLTAAANRGGKFERLALPDADADIWSVLIHPKDPRRIYAGATPIAVYRSDDGGEHWKKLADPGLPNRVIMAFACRVMRLDVDPNSPDDIYATMEANGAMRSRNAGESWEDCTADLIRFCEEPKYRSRIGSQTEIEGMLDGHALACSAAAPGTVFLANRMGLFRSADKGEHWVRTWRSAASRR